jgi:type II secretory pathway pseudopilin PulG
VAAGNNHKSFCFEIKNVFHRLGKEKVKMKNLLRLLLKSQHRQHRSPQAQTEKGMTLIELLIGMVMAFLIITPMLAFVVDMLNTDRREQVKANTEQDIQAAVDFIAQDLSQAIYIYDNDGINTGANPINGQLPTVANGTPILVFWKRQLQRNALPITPIAPDNPAPSACNQNPIPGTPAANDCNDTYVLSLVAYYQVSAPDTTWCPQDGGLCPARIVRYYIRDGLKDPKALAGQPYYTAVNTGQAMSPAFNRQFDISRPTQNVALANRTWESDVLVNYIDHSPSPTATANECQTALSNPRTTDSSNALIDEPILKITTPTNSFYACVDTTKNLARVTIRGNSLRRLQSNANYNPDSSAFFPTANVQVQGQGARGN